MKSSNVGGASRAVVVGLKCAPTIGCIRRVFSIRSRAEARVEKSLALQSLATSHYEQCRGETRRLSPVYAHHGRVNNSKHDTVCPQPSYDELLPSSHSTLSL